MLLNFLHSKKQQFFFRLEKFTASSNWKIKITLLSVVLSLFFAFPSYQTYLSGRFEDKWSAIDAQVKEPFVQHNYDDFSHFSKLAFRITVPLIAHALHLGRAGCFLIQYVCFLLLFYFLLSLAFASVQDKISAALISFAFAFMFVGNVLVSDLRALFDVTAFCFIAAAMYFRNPLLVILFSLLAFFTDERALIASPLMLIWFLVRSSDKNNFSFQDLFRFTSKVFTLLVSWLLYGALRYFFATHFGLHSGTGGTNMFAKQVNNFLFGAWTGLEGFWLIIFLGFILLYVNRSWSLMFVTAAAMLLVMVIAFSVVDITRSVAYLFPAVFIFLELLRKNESAEFVRKISLFTFLICLFPTYYTDGEGAIWFFYPLPVRVIGLLGIFPT